MLCKRFQIFSNNKMKENRVISIKSNPDYLIIKTSGEVDFIDHYQLRSDKLSYSPEPKDLMIAFFKAFPASFKLLLNLRESVAGLLKLKTAPQSEKASRLEKLHHFKGDIGDQITLFEVLDKSDKELLTGQKDSHLDFKLSFITYQINDSISLEMVTVVNINNSIGKVYFGIVKPIHKWYMKKILKNMEKELISKTW